MAFSLMTEIRQPRGAKWIFVLLCGLLGLVSGTLAAQEIKTLNIGYLEITNDPRYEALHGYARIQFKSRSRPRAGAELAMRESQIIGRALSVKFRLEPTQGETSEQLVSEIERLAAEKNVQFFLIDAPAEIIREVAEKTKNRDGLLFNISERSDSLRAGDCAANLMHTIASHAMLSDALAQYLISQNWRRALVLKGQLPVDTALARAFENSARRFGIDIAAIEDFILSNDPRVREKNNIKLMTSGFEYDVVFLADSDGEFGRYVPYQTQLPRPVVGTEGLIASEWHWAWERHGAPQLNRRFAKRAKRRMQPADWAAWIAVTSIVESVVRTKSVEFGTISEYLRGEDLTLDGYKGAPVSYRSWDNQLRQPILLHTHNAVIGRAPLEGFLHPTQYMDTLGFDLRDAKCR